jgi:hypothetical protein
MGFDDHFAEGQAQSAAPSFLGAGSEFVEEVFLQVRGDTLTRVVNEEDDPLPVRVGVNIGRYPDQALAWCKFHGITYQVLENPFN